MAKPLCSEREFVLGGATVLLARGPADARTGLVARAAGGVLELPPDRISVQHSCPRCGGRDHGRPVVAAIGTTHPYASTGMLLELAALRALGVRPVAVVAGVSAQDADRVLARRALDPAP